MSEELGTATNRYVTVRTVNEGTQTERFYVNIIGFNGKVDTFGSHGYSHKRSARRAAKTLAKHLDLVYGQDYEYVGSEVPHSCLASK